MRKHWIKKGGAPGRVLRVSLKIKHSMIYDIYLYYLNKFDIENR